MRDIKVRVWDYNKNEMTIGYSLKRLPAKYKKKHYRYLEYTGLKDKNGVEIYEGDIIKSDKNCFFGEEYETGSVQFIEGGFAVQSVWLTTLVKAFKPKIIGNIHENPELLKETK